MTPSRLDEIRDRLRVRSSQVAGYPLPRDLDFTGLGWLLELPLNQCGDPDDLTTFDVHVRGLEREVVRYVARLWRAPEDDRWGYVTSGSTEGITYGVIAGRERWPDSGPILYHSAAAHYCVPKIGWMLRMPTISIPTDAGGEMDYAALSAAVALNPHRPAVVVATVGTTMTEARDDVATVRQAVRAGGATECHIHVDAALTGLYLPFHDPRPSFDLSAGADSMSTSGLKGLGVPVPSGIVVTRRSIRDSVARTAVAYLGGHDTTVSGSRSGHTVAMLWWAISELGEKGLRDRARGAVEAAAEVEERIRRAGWRCWRNPGAMTVVIARPSEPTVRRWQLATEGGWSHVLCLPGLDTDNVKQLIEQLAVEADVAGAA